MTGQTEINEMKLRQMEATSGGIEWNIYQRMLKVTEAVERVPKGDKMVANQYKFTSHDAVMAALRPAFIKYGICMIPTVLAHSQDGNRTEVTMSIDFVNCDKPDDRVSVETFGYGIDSQDKGPGKAISYAVKYACLKAFALDTGDDPESDQSTEHKPAKTASNSSMRSADDPNWTGPLNKTALKAALREIGAMIRGCEDSTQLGVYLEDAETKSAMQQGVQDLPDWMHGNADSDGLFALIDKTKKELLESEFPGHFPPNLSDAPDLPSDEIPEL